jgi:DNA-binding transcriptional MocR family regulator
MQDGMPLPMPNSRLTIVDFAARPGIVDFSYGYPARGLLPTAGLQQAAAATLARYGADALLYGAPQGPGTLVEQLCARLATHENLRVSPAQLLISGGASQALDQICSLLTRPGDVVLAPVPTYHLAVRIFKEYPLELVPVAGDDAGLSVDALAAQVQRLRVEGKRPRLVYVVPTFSNPSGHTLGESQRRQLYELARQEELLLIEDDVYRELVVDERLAPPPSIFSYGPPGPVVRLGSFSKTLAPGLRVGWLLADEAIVRRFVASGLYDSGGGTAHFAALVVETFLALDLYEAHLEQARQGYRARYQALLAGLKAGMPAGVHWTKPGGGYFVWLRLPAGLDSARLLPIAETQGVTFLSGARFCLGLGGHDCLRLSFSFLSPDELYEGARRLGTTIRELH